MTVPDRIRAVGLIPVVTFDRAADAESLGDALMAGGLPCAEVTFRTDAAPSAIETLAGRFPDMLVGAGTVLTVDQARTAVSVGSSFVVSPGFDEAVVDWCVEHETPVIPGVMTPTEVMRALTKGVHLLKFFPAEAAGGVRSLQAMTGVFPDVEFVPTGGIGTEQLADYLRLPTVAACGGSWMASRQLIARGEFDQIERMTATAVAVVRSVRAAT